MSIWVVIYIVIALACWPLIARYWVREDLRTYPEYDPNFAFWAFMGLMLAILWPVGLTMAVVWGALHVAGKAFSVTLDKEMDG